MTTLTPFTAQQIKQQTIAELTQYLQTLIDTPLLGFLGADDNYDEYDLEVSELSPHHAALLDLEREYFNHH